MAELSYDIIGNMEFTPADALAFARASDYIAASAVERATPSQVRGLFGEIAASRGYCSGIATIVAAARSNAMFQCFGKPPSATAYGELMAEALRLYRSRSRDRVLIPGFCGFRQACVAYQRTTLDLALDTNLEVAASAHMWADMSGIFSGMSAMDLNGSAADGGSCQASGIAARHNAVALQQIIADINQRRMPVVLLNSGRSDLISLPHSVAVAEAHIRHRADGTLDVMLMASDPNNPNDLRMVARFITAPDYSWARVERMYMPSEVDENFATITRIF